MLFQRCCHLPRNWNNVSRRCSTAAVRVRFAPSPTGDLHLGGLRTALVNFLAARAAGKGSSFLLRIEDTDRARNVERGAESIAEILRWAHLDYDEGPDIGGPFAPYIQSERLAIYQHHAEELMQKGAAYPCFCPPSAQTGAYDRTCLKLGKHEAEEKLSRYRKENLPFVVRLKMPEGVCEVEDSLRGVVSIDANVLDDAILIKSDGFPTYHLAAVVDDHTMNITHVIRGEEWLMSLPKAITIYKAFGWIPPVFTHLPIILNPEGGKLSKRHGHSSVKNLREAGYLWQAVVNYLGILGSHDSQHTTVMSLSDLQAHFRLSALSMAKPTFDVVKLNWFNQQYIKMMSEEEINNAVCWLHPFLLSKYPSFFSSRSSKDADVYVTTAFKLLQPRITTLKDVLEYEYLFGSPQFSDDVTKAVLKVPKFADILSQLHQLLSGVNFSVAEVETVIQGVVNSRKKPHVFLPLRYAITGVGAGPAIGDLLVLMGKDQTLLRIDAALAYLRNAG